MKKIFCGALVIALCLGMTAFAAVPSKSTDTLEVVVPFEDAVLTTKVVSGKEADAEKLNVVVNEELASLFAEVQAAATTEQKNASISNFFGANVESMLIGNGELTVADFMPVFTDGFPKAVGDETFEIQMGFDTKFVPGTQVIIAVGKLDANGNIVWTYVIGNVQPDGTVLCNMPLKVMDEIQAIGGIIATITYSSNIAAA